MNKRLALAVAVASMFAAIPAAQAATATGNFNVTVNLTSACTISTPPGNITIAYTAMGAAQNGSTNYQVTCTNTLPYSMSVDSAAGTYATTNLNWTIAVDTAAKAGSGAAQNYAITATIPAGQAGTCATGTCSETMTRTLTVTY